MNDGSIVKYILFDLDGTLINVNSITHLIGQWEDFAEATLTCPPHERMVEYARLCQGVAEIIVVTGKHERFYPRVLDWLALQGIIPEVVLMRPNLNSESDATLKPRLIEQYLGERWRDQVLFAVEDRDKMVEAWRALDVICLQCAPSLY